jgi:RNA polymerase sigma factor (sigma-70 family)
MSIIVASSVLTPPSTRPSGGPSGGVEEAQAAACTPRQQALALFMVQRPRLVHYASQIAGDPAAGEDVVQDAWLRFDAIVSLRPLTEPMGYLHRVVRNLALDARRRRRRESAVVASCSLDEIAESAPDGRPTPEMVALYSDQYTLIQRALAELPGRTRTALTMHRLGGARLREIAAALGVSVPMVHHLVAQGVRHCRRRLSWPSPAE